MTYNVIVIFAVGLIIFFASSSAQTVLEPSSGSDLTLVPGSKGLDVVDACIQKINSVSGIGFLLSNDFGFLKRLALIESNFGNSAASPRGGIWQITSAIITDLKNNNRASINFLINVLANELGQDILDFTSHDFSVPLKSAVAARLYIEIKVSNQSFPASIEEQANWWKNNYNGDDATSNFIAKVESYENINRCTVSKLDLWFLIDGSGSIGSSNFVKCLDFVNQTSALFDISPDNVRTGLMIYESTTTVRSYLNQNRSNSLFSSVVMSTPYPGGGTNTGSAIARIAQEGFNVSNGARPENKGVPRILVVLTDGQSQDNVTLPSLSIQQSGVTVFGVGVGSGYNKKEINEIASDPDSLFAYEISQFSALATVLRDRVVEQACTAPALIRNNTEISLMVLPQSTIYSEIEIPSNGSVELRYEVNETTSTGVVYLSESVANPNAAINDASFDVNVGVTSVIYNAKGTSSSSNRTKRETEASNTNPLYIAFTCAGSEPINMQFTAETSTRRVKSESNVVRGMAAHSILDPVLGIALVFLLVIEFVLYV